MPAPTRVPGRSLGPAARAVPAAPLAKLGPYQAAVVPVQACEAGRQASGTQAGSFRQIILPDLLIVAPRD